MVCRYWQSLTDTIAQSFMYLGFEAGGIGFPQVYLLNPGNIAYRGFTAKVSSAICGKFLKKPIGPHKLPISVMIGALAVKPR